MSKNLQSSTKDKYLHGISGWLIVFVVFLGVNILLTFIQGVAFETDLFLTLITFAFTVLIIVFLFTKKIIFRLLFIILMAADLGFCMMHFFRLELFEILNWYPEAITFFIISLSKLLVFSIYLFKSKRVQNTFCKNSTTLSGASSAFLIFVISFIVVNILSLIETIMYTKNTSMLLHQTPFISNIMAYILTIVFCAVIILLIIKRKASFRPIFIIMMLLQISLLFMVNSYGLDVPSHGISLNPPMNVAAQCAYSFFSVIAWSIVICKSRSIKQDFSIEA